MDTYADADDAKVHGEEGPEAPVYDYVPEVFESPLSTAVDAREVLVVDQCVFARKGRTAMRNEFPPSRTVGDFAGW